MAAIITDPKKDIAKINREFSRLDQIDNQMNTLLGNVQGLTNKATQNDLKHTPQTTNNLTFTWNGNTNAIIWNSGYIQDSNKKVWQVPFGVKAADPNTTYWIAWNVFHQQLVVSAEATPVIQNNSTRQDNMLFICDLVTGDPLEFAIAGGGGSESGGSAPSGRSYKLLA